MATVNMYCQGRAKDKNISGHAEIVKQCELTQGAISL